MATRALSDDTATAGAAPITSVLVVPGMHCAGCMGKVERALASLSGVQGARVNLTARSVRVEHDAGLGLPDMVAALAAAGFESQPRSDALALPVSQVKPLLAPLGVAGFACMNVMLLSVSVWSGADGATRDLFHWLSAGLGVPAIVYAGRVFFVSALGALRRGRTNMDVPISIGVVLATGLSLYETFTHGAEAWFDGTLMLLLFLLAGRVLDAMMRDRARAGVDALLRQAASGAMVVRAGQVEWLASADLLPGMVMRVAAGERLAADGAVVAGVSRFDQSMLTGESAPVAAGVGAPVLAGMLNLDAPVDVRVNAGGKDTTLAEMARLMEAAGQTRSRYVRIADRASRLYAPAVHTLAAASFVGWMLAGAGVYASIKIAIAVLIITCPCALGLAVPVAQVVAASGLMRVGVMVKDGAALERLASVDRALLDKTGTLTLGRAVPDAAALAALGDEAASVALALASHSRHPLSTALVRALAPRVAPADVQHVEDIPGWGLRGLWQGRAVALRRPDGAGALAAQAQQFGTSPGGGAGFRAGNEEDRGCGGIACVLDIAGQTNGAGQTMGASNAQMLYLLPFADRLRPDAKAALGWLGKMGITSSILSGDNAAAVAQVARSTGLTAQSSASPQDKLDAISRLQGGGHRVLMVGDGLNDGPALAAADASLAPGSASDVGRQTSDMVFLTDSLLAVPRALATARACQQVVRQNFALAIGYNALAVPLAMAGYVTPLLAAVAMSTSSLLVIGNSLRLARGVRVPAA